ncbi:expressed unknown protein [Seminavis robusta]|uniref:Domain of unknown function at the cortex 1 domain-containing protein n=1 Tax=Seminavis robusta TaxID=568900 RepID=A0A9N8EA25_9STRA|nr:expressed unknown protein [Seminavis robusta]|eukprot:Sro673_g185270.1 n/a (287) ;mRNA; f:38640-39500
MTINTSIYAIDKETGERCWVNAKAPRSVSNESLEGDIMLLMRDGEHSGYFEGRQRRFDLQFQFRLKKKTNTMWYGVELDESLNLGTVQRLTAKAALGFCQKMNPGSFHSRISKEPCMVFKVANSMDAIARTVPGDFLPCLGEAIEESRESIRKREKEGMEWNTRDTFTISCFSAYFDFLSWSIMNLPVIPTIDATKVVGTQPFRFVLYTLKNEDGPHVPENKNYVFNLEICNPSKTTIGPAAMKWIKKYEKREEADPAASPRTSKLMTGRLSLDGSECFTDPIVCM